MSLTANEEDGLGGSIVDGCAVAAGVQDHRFVDVAANERERNLEKLTLE